MRIGPGKRCPECGQAISFRADRSELSRWDVLRRWRGVTDALSTFLSVKCGGWFDYRRARLDE